MDKNFIENCKLLKQHFTQLTQADTTAQSKCNESSNGSTAHTVINDARKLLLTERIEALCDEDIAKIREKSVDQYAREMKHYHESQNYRLCKPERLKWDDELFNSPLPHPKNNAKFLKSQKKNIDQDIDKERKHFEELAKMLMGKIEYSKNYISKSNKNTEKTEIDKLGRKEEKVERIINYESEQTINNEPEIEAIDIENIESKQFEELENTLLGKIEYSESFKSESNKNTKKTEIEKLGRKEEQVVRISNYESEQTINNELVLEAIYIENIKRKQFEEIANTLLGKNEYSESYKSKSNKNTEKTETEKLGRKEEKVVRIINYESEQTINNKPDIEAIERKQFEELATTLLGKIESSESYKSESNKNTKKTEIEKPERKEEKVVRIITYESEQSINNESEIEAIDIEDIKHIDLEAVEIKTNTSADTIDEIPELIITSQKSKALEFLDVKKINIEDKENTEDYDNTKKDRNVEPNKEKYKRHIDESRQAKINNANKKIDNFLDIVKRFQQKKMNKSKSDITQSSLHKAEQITAEAKPKSSLNVDSKVASFAHRFKAQKSIIEMQKKKLEEQHRMIEDLKLNRIKSDARKSLENAKKIQQRIISDSRAKFKPKLEVKAEATESVCTQKELNLSINSNKAPKIVKMMEERARERHEKRLLIQERKMLLQEEKQRIAKELVETKLKEKVEEKQERAKKLKQQRDTVRQMELKKQMEKNRYLKLSELAIEHYKKKLKQSAMSKFKMLIFNVKIRSEIAKRFYENNIVIKCFLSWYTSVSEILDIKNKIAMNLYSMNLMVQSISCWKSYHVESIQHNQVAIDRYEMSLQLKYFLKWHQYVCENRVQKMLNAKKADKYYRRVLLFQCFSNWRNLPAIMQIERVQNERKRKWRLRVAEVLSDYDPLKSYDF